MDNLSKPLLMAHATSEFPIYTFLVIITFALIMIGVMTYSFQLGYKMSAQFPPLVDATMEIKLETTTAHLWFEEIISGDRNEIIEDVLNRIDNAMWYATALLNGGYNSKGYIAPLSDLSLRKDIKEVLANITTFREITQKRYATIKESGVGSEIDQKYDAIFRGFQKKTDSVETKLQEIIVSDLYHYRFLQILLLITLIFSTIVLLFIFYKYENQRAKNQKLIRESLEKVKVLSGFLPMCASCKKIRDDKGYWSQIESYIREHSEAEFSHGICPECAKKIYPEINI